MKMDEPRLHLILIFLLAVAITFAISRGQMMEIRDFKGLITDADVEDLPVEAATKLKNLIPENGRLVKDFGFGSLISTPLTGTVFGLYTFLDDNLTMDSGEAGRAYIAYTVDSNKRAMLFVWDGSAWDSLTVSAGHLLSDFPATYHLQDYNPFFQEGNVLRVLPGATGAPDGSNEGQGIWVGYIERDYFDGAYAPDTGYYGYSTAIDKAILGNYSATWGTTAAVGAGLGNSERFYHITELYDGLQEGLLSQYLYFDGDTAALRRIRLKIDTTFNKRMTNIKLYRSTAPEDTSYEILNADFNRDDTPYTSDSVLNGIKTLYIKGGLPYKTFSDTFDIADFDSVDESRGRFVAKILGDYEALFDSVHRFKITACDSNNGAATVESSSVSAGTTFIYAFKFPAFVHDTTNGGVIVDIPGYDITVNGSEDTFEISTDIYNNGPESLITILNTTKVNWDSYSDDVKWGVNWTLRSFGYNDYPYNQGPFFYYSFARIQVTTGTNLYTGSTMVFLDTNFTNNTLSGDMLVYYDTLYSDAQADGTQERIIERNTGIVVDLYGAKIGTTAGYHSGQLLTAEDGYYFFADSGSYFDLFMYDPDIPAGSPHYLTNEVSTKVNGQYHLLAGDRAWLGDVVLNPGGDNEEHDNWLMYSEAGKYDVFPVSNAFRIGGYGGGGLTGLTEIFGNPVPMTKNTIKIVDIKSNPGNPGSWRVIESAHNIGNVAPRGFINVRGDVYFTSYDGWYRFSPNNLAETDQTPTNRLKISAPIQDMFDTLTVTQKEGVVCGYDQYQDEIIFRIPGMHVTATTETIGCSKATYIENVNQSTNYGSVDSMKMYLKPVPADWYKALMYFDLSGIPGTGDIDTAYFRLYSEGGDFGFGDPFYEVHRLRRTWNEDQANWHVAAVADSWATAGAGNTTTDHYNDNITNSLMLSMVVGYNSVAIQDYDALEGICGTSPDTTNHGFLFAPGLPGPDPHLASDDADSVPQLVVSYSDTSDGYFAYNVGAGSWREINTGLRTRVMTLDESGYLMTVNIADLAVHSREIAESTSCRWASKTFAVDNEEKLLAPKYIYLNYKCTVDTVDCFIYADHETTPSDTLVYPPVSVPTMTRKFTKVRAKKFRMELQTRGAYNNDELEIYSIGTKK